MSANPLDLSKVSGSSTLKTALESTLGASNAGLEFTITGGATYRWNGSSFDTISIGGAALVTDGGLATKITVSGSVTYIGEAVAGTAQATASWRCQKIDESSGTVITWADGNTNFDNVATDLTALTYS